MIKLKPLIKWTGGKSSELKHILPLIPDYDRYIEPFFGGGALYFNLHPKKAIINDIIPELMDFYKLVKDGNELFKKELEEYVLHWNLIEDFILLFDDKIYKIYVEYRKNELSDSILEENINTCFDIESPGFYKLFTEEFCIDQFELLECFRTSLISRLIRIKNGIDRNSCFDVSDIYEHIETGYRSGFYTHFRNFHNNKLNHKQDIKKEKWIANYYFLREYCFGGMFRHNFSGEFNIPYGGRNYNKKNFERKVNILFSQKTQNLFKGTTIENDDFEKVIQRNNLNEHDFVFLDPPYDSVFNEYDSNSFTIDDQKRLRNILKNTKAKFILIIKETPLISDIYSDQGHFKMKSFDKTYTSNIKSRYNRNSKHLIIRNL